MPSSRNVGAHWPTNSASWSRPLNFSASEPRIDPPASHRNVSEGSLAVYSSIGLASPPSLCSPASDNMGDMGDSFQLGLIANITTSPNSQRRSGRPPPHPLADPGRFGRDSPPH